MVVADGGLGGGTSGTRTRRDSGPLRPFVLMPTMTYRVDPSRRRRPEQRRRTSWALGFVRTTGPALLRELDRLQRRRDEGVFELRDGPLVEPFVLQLRLLRPARRPRSRCRGSRAPSPARWRPWCRASPRRRRSPRTDPVNRRISSRSTLAGLVPSVFTTGTVNCSLTSSPRRSAVKSAGGAGTRTSGGSGAPFFPHAIDAPATISHGERSPRRPARWIAARGLPSARIDRARPRSHRMYRDRSSFLTMSSSIFVT